jgi:tetratricopeptide (TPR) repeat protein
MGCQEMDAVTYPSPAVIDFIQRNMIPLRIQSDNEGIGLKFEIRWTPTVITLNKKGNEHYRTVGFLNSNSLISSLMLGIGKIRFDRGEYQAAVSEFEKLIATETKNNFVAEAIYFRGVALYKLTNDLGSLKKAYDKLAAEYPDSEWTEKAYPYKGIDI